jgi:hypothetical protein
MRSNTQLPKFCLEQEMSRPVSRWLRSQNLITKPEFRTPWGICDFVAMEFNPANTASRIALGQKQPIGTPLRVAVLDAIPENGDGITLSALHRRCTDLLSVTQLERELAALQKGRFIVCPVEGHFKKVNGWAPLHNRIVAIELKLARIEEALSQARSHLAFATESYVAFPAGVAERVVESPRIDDFRTSGVGLIAVGRSRCKVLLQSKNVHHADRILQMHFTERFWRTSVTSNAS